MKGTRVELSQLSDLIVLAQAPDSARLVTFLVNLFAVPIAALLGAYCVVLMLQGRLIGILGVIAAGLLILGIFMNPSLLVDFADYLINLVFSSGDGS